MRSVCRPRSVVAFLAFAALATAPVMVSVAAAGATVPDRVTAQSSDTSPSDVLATLTVSSEKVSVRKDGKKKFKPAKDGQKLRQGDTIQTDATGTAEVDYGNDAFTRLDVNTTFTIVVLTDEQGARQVQGSLETGQTWNRTAALTESGSFEQEGAGANATVRGTAFSITCDAVDHCTFTAVVDDIDLTGFDGVTRLLTPLTQCESTDSTEGAQRDLTGVLCGDITQIPADQIPAWILQNLIKDLTLGLPDGGILTGTVVVTSAGAVVFVPGPPPPSGSGGGSGPVVAAPQIDDPPIAVDYGAFGAEAAGPLTFNPSSSIDVLEGTSAYFVVRVVPGFSGNVYVVFVTLPEDVGRVCSTPANDCNNVHVRGAEHPAYRYAADTVFTFAADSFAGCDSAFCASSVVHSDDMSFYLENEAGDLTSDTVAVAVNVEEEILTCAEGVTASC